MPRRMKSEVYARPTPRPFNGAALTAAGRRMDSMPSLLKRAQVRAEDWQATSWRFFDNIGEYRYSCEWVGNILSKAILYIEKDGKPAELFDEKGNTIAPAPEYVEPLTILNSLFDGPDGQSEMLRLIGIHMTAAGECYIVASENADQSSDDWMVAASTEFKRTADDQWTLTDEGETGQIINDPFVMRLWRSHPRLINHADAPGRAVIPVLRELEGLTKRGLAQIQSRLASAGILVVPTEVTFGSAATQALTDQEDDGAEQVADDTFVEILIRTAAEAIGDQDSAAALVPIVIKVPGEYVDKVQHIDFSSALDAASIELRKEAISRLALGMDMPPEVLLGTTDMNHWSSWQVEEAAIKAHTEPLLEILTSALNVGYLRPLLIDAGMSKEDASHWSIQADTSKMRLRPNRSVEATALWDRALITNEAVIRENGFDPADTMDETERAIWLLFQLGKLGQGTPGTFVAALEKLGVQLGPIPDIATDTREILGADGKPVNPDQKLQNGAPSLGNYTQHGPGSGADPNSQGSGGGGNGNGSGDGGESDGDYSGGGEYSGGGTYGASLLMASEVIVFRALERAGNRLRSKMGGNKIIGTAGLAISAADTYRHVRYDEKDIDGLLHDSWAPAIDMFAGAWGIDGTKYEAQLNEYTHELMRERRPHDRELLAKYLEPVGAE